MFSLLLEVSQRPAQYMTWYPWQSVDPHLVWLYMLVSLHHAEYRCKKVLLLNLFALEEFCCFTVIQAYRAISGASQKR